MYKVLIFGMTENPGGIESVIINYYKKINDKYIHFDFLCSSENHIAYESYLKRNSKIYKIIPRRKNPILFRTQLNNFFKKNAQNYDCLWMNVNNLVNIDYLIFARKYGIHRRIIHSHNSKMMENGIVGFLKTIIHDINKKRLSRFATDYWACSENAAKWLYPKELFSQVKIIKNAISLDKTKFNLTKRNRIRNIYGLKNKIVFGNVGRLQYQKNQFFLLKIFKEINTIVPNSTLILIGDGPDKQKIKKKIQILNLNNKVIMTGIQDNVSDWYSAFDLFLFPSRFEGISISMLEAQANGLPILASDNVNPKEIKVNQNVIFENLNTPVNIWVNEAAQSLKWGRLSDKKIRYNFERKGYDINSASHNLVDAFLN